LHKTLFVAHFLVIAACGQSAPEVRVEGAWIAPAGTTAAAYLALVNHGGPDRLLSVAAPGVGTASVHQSSMDGGVMRMRPMRDGLAIGQGARVALQPMGTHVMIEQLARPLAAGDKVTLTLRFERQGEVAVSAEVRAAGHDGMAH
jgi:copper(I)-binding protein